MTMIIIITESIENEGMMFLPEESKLDTFWDEKTTQNEENVSVVVSSVRMVPSQSQYTQGRMSQTSSLSSLWRHKRELGRQKVDVLHSPCLAFGSHHGRFFSSFMQCFLSSFRTLSSFIMLYSFLVLDLASLLVNLVCVCHSFFFAKSSILPLERMKENDWDTREYAMYLSLFSVESIYLSIFLVRYGSSHGVPTSTDTELARLDG